MAKAKRRTRVGAGDAQTIAVSQSTLATLLETSRKVIGELEADGMPHSGVGREKRYDLFKVLPFLKERWLSRESAGTSKNLERYRAARASREELALSRDRGEFVRLSMVLAIWSDRIVETRVRLQGLPSSLAPQLQGLSVVDADKLMARAIRDVCESLARDWISSLSDPPADGDVGTGGGD